MCLDIREVKTQKKKDRIVYKAYYVTPKKALSIAKDPDKNKSFYVCSPYQCSRYLFKNGHEIVSNRDKDNPTELTDRELISLCINRGLHSLTNIQNAINEAKGHCCSDESLVVFEMEAKAENQVAMGFFCTDPSAVHHKLTFKRIAAIVHGSVKDGETKNRVIYKAPKI